MLRFLLTLTFCSVLAAQEAPVKLPVLDSKSYSAHELVQSANALIALGKEKAVAALEARLAAPADRARSHGDRGERVSWLCRLVFEAPAGATLRAPQFGALSLPYKSMPLSRWPRYPLALQDGVPFVLSEGYMLAGLGEPPRKYLEFCATHGVFRTKPFELPAQATAMAAHKALTSSKRWQALAWIHKSEGLQYEIDEKHVVRTLAHQAQRCPPGQK